PPNLHSFPTRRSSDLLHPVACPELAPLIQAGNEVDADLVALVEEYCAPLRRAEVDTVILGCTHYPLVRPMLQRALGRGVTLVTRSESTRLNSSHLVIS